VTGWDLLSGYVDVVDAVASSGDVWGPALLGGSLTVGAWRLQPGGGRHRMPSAPWATVRTAGRTAGRTVAERVRTASSALVRPTPDGRPASPAAPPVTSADGRPASADGRPPGGGREDGGG
jgi:hypothetical protein